MVNPNDIKKGESIIMRSGMRGFMNDNKKGAIRQMRINDDIGDEYVAKIAYVLRDGCRVPVSATPEQRRPYDVCESILGGL